MKPQTPKQKLALEYGSNLRVIKGCCTQLRNAISKLLPAEDSYHPLVLKHIEQALTDANKVRFEVKREELAESAPLTTLAP